MVYNVLALVGCFTMFHEENMQQKVHVLIEKYKIVFQQQAWQDMICGISPEVCGCGDVYRASNYVCDGVCESLVIADMRTLVYSEPHYHPAPVVEIYFVLQGTASVIVGTKRYEVVPGDVVVIPPLQAHYVLPDSNFVIGVVNTPPFILEHYIPLYESDELVDFDVAEFKNVIATLGNK